LTNSNQLKETANDEYTMIVVDLLLQLHQQSMARYTSFVVCCVNGENVQMKNGHRQPKIKWMLLLMFGDFVPIFPTYITI
jgi:hypothetical protein